MAKFMNIVRCKVKSTHREEYLKACDERPKFDGNVSILAVNFYTLKIDKTGLTKKTKNDGIYAPLVLLIISAILCYGLADKIYV